MENIGGSPGACNRLIRFQFTVARNRRAHGGRHPYCSPIAKLSEFGTKGAANAVAGPVRAENGACP